MFLTKPDNTSTGGKAKKRTFRFPRALVALEQRNFRIFWSGQMISLIGTWMQTVGQAWLVLMLTDSALELGLVGALQFLPVLLFGLYGGVLADRFPKRSILLCTQSIAAIQGFALWLLIVSGHIQLWHVFIFAFLLGLIQAVDTPTRQSFVVEMVGRSTLPNAIALNSSVFNMARIIGPSIAGLLIAAFGVTPLFLLDALSFIPVIIGLLLIDTKQLYTSTKTQTQTENQHAFKSIGEGLRYIGRTPVILLVILLVASISLFGINFNITLPLIATETLKVDAVGYGMISAFFGIGALLAAFSLAWKSTGPNVRHILISGILFGVFECLFALSRWYVLSLILIVIVGFMMVSFTAMSNTILQTVTPDHLRGRIMSVYLLVFNGSTPIGNLFTGAIANIAGAAFSVLIGGFIALLAAITGWIFRKPAEKSIKEHFQAYDLVENLPAQPRKSATAH